jgi:hypothetical protein
MQARFNTILTPAFVSRAFCVSICTFVLGIRPTAWVFLFYSKEDFLFFFHAARWSALFTLSHTPFRTLCRHQNTRRQSPVHMRCVHSKEVMRCTDITASDRGTHTHTHTHTHTQTHTRSCRPHPLPLVTFTLPRTLAATTYAIILL